MLPGGNIGATRRRGWYAMGAAARSPATERTTMRIGMPLNYSGGFKETVDELATYEKAGLDIVYVAEAYSFDAVSQMGFIAARTGWLISLSGLPSPVPWSAGSGTV